MDADAHAPFAQADAVDAVEAVAQFEAEAVTVAHGAAAVSRTPGTGAATAGTGKAYNFGGWGITQYCTPLVVVCRYAGAGAVNGSALGTGSADGTDKARASVRNINKPP